MNTVSVSRGECDRNHFGYGEPHHHILVVKEHPLSGDRFTNELVHPGLSRTDCDPCVELTATMQQYFNIETDPDASQKLNDEQEALAKELTDIAAWWVTTSKADAERTVPKAIEYGSADLDFMGQAMVALLGEKFKGADADEKMRAGREIAIMFYQIGKLGRALGAFAQGVLPSDDTLFDNRVYAMMWQRVRETGNWIEG